MIGATSAAIHGYRRLALTLATLVLLSNVLTAYLLNRLPDDPLHVASHLSAYSYFASLLSILGIVGAKRSNATLVAIFANYLLLDALLSAVPRLLALVFFPSMRDSVCSIDSVSSFLRAQSPSLFAASMDPSTESQIENTEFEMQGQCKSVVTVLLALAGLAAAAITCIQIMLALRVGRFAKILGDREEQERDFVLCVAEKYRDEPNFSPSEKTLVLV